MIYCAPTKSITNRPLHNIADVSCTANHYLFTDVDAEVFEKIIYCLIEVFHGKNKTFGFPHFLCIGKFLLRLKSGTNGTSTDPAALLINKIFKLED